jgi:hypothetical protein
MARAIKSDGTIVVATSTITGNKGVADSGCSKDLCANIDLFVTLEPCRYDIKGIGAADINSTAIGTVHVKTRCKDGSYKTMIVPETLFVPELPHMMLLSMSKLAQRDGSFQIRKSGATLSIPHTSFLEKPGQNAADNVDLEVTVLDGIYTVDMLDTRPAAQVPPAPRTQPHVVVSLYNAQ